MRGSRHPVRIGNKTYNTLLDSGAFGSVMSKKFYRTLPKESVLDFSPDDSVCYAADNSPLVAEGKALVKISLYEDTFYRSFLIIPDLCHDMLLGRDFLNKEEVTMTFSEKPGKTRIGEEKLGVLQGGDLPVPVRVRRGVCISSGTTASVHCSVPVGVRMGSYSVNIQSTEKLLPEGVTVLAGAYNIGPTGFLTMKMTNGAETVVTLPEGKEVVILRPFALLAKKVHRKIEAPMVATIGAEDRRGEDAHDGLLVPTRRNHRYCRGVGMIGATTSERETSELMREWPSRMEGNLTCEKLHEGLEPISDDFRAPKKSSRPQFRHGDRVGGRETVQADTHLSELHCLSNRGGGRQQDCLREGGSYEASKMVRACPSRYKRREHCMGQASGNQQRISLV